MSKKTALIVGASGLVGHELLNLLLEDDYYEKVKVIARRAIDRKDERLEVRVEPDFEKLEMHKEYLTANHVYCCLGTTIKQAGSEENFKKVDLDYPIKLAEIVKDYSGFESYHMITSIGANADSPLFYNLIKGMAEEKVKALNLKSLYIYRPSLLIGQRSEFRLGEEVAKAFSAFISFFVIGSRRGRVWSIHGHDVALAMYKSAQQSKEGTHTLVPKHMLKLTHL